MSALRPSQQVRFSAHAKCCGTAFGKEEAEKPACGGAALDFLGNQRTEWLLDDRFQPKAVMPRSGGFGQTGDEATHALSASGEEDPGGAECPRRSPAFSKSPLGPASSTEPPSAWPMAAGCGRAK